MSGPDTGEIFLPHTEFIVLEERARSVEAEPATYLYDAIGHAVDIANAYLENEHDGQETVLTVSVPGQDSLEISINPYMDPMQNISADSTPEGVQNPFVDQWQVVDIDGEMLDLAESVAERLGIETERFVSWATAVKHLIDGNVLFGCSVFVNDGIDGVMLLARPAESS